MILSLGRHTSTPQTEHIMLHAACPPVAYRATLQYIPGGNVPRAIAVGVRQT
jgi:hypothetical protein